MRHKVKSSAVMMRLISAADEEASAFRILTDHLFTNSALVARLVNFHLACPDGYAARSADTRALLMIFIASRRA